MQTLLLSPQICLTALSNAETSCSVPNPFILTLISVTIVFSALVCLIYTYTLIGKIANIKFRRGEGRKQCGPTEKEAAAIATALKIYMNQEMHDEESYVITIKRK
jgi:Na+-transporting methylmalonyl-CoA/oxaloacetate decarboxylase gamma subunit